MPAFLFHLQMVYDSKWIYRIHPFDVYELNLKQITSLKSKIGFIVNIYVPLFVETNLTQTVPYVPSIFLLTRDLMKDFGVPHLVKQCFLEHAQHWMSPVNAAVCVHQEAPVILEDNKGNISKHKGTVLEQQTRASYLLKARVLLALQKAAVLT